MDISMLALPQAILDDKAEYIAEIQLDEDKLIRDNCFFSDYVVSIETHTKKVGLNFFADLDNEIIYFYGNENDYTKIWKAIFVIYKAEWIKPYLSVYKWYDLYEITHGEEVEDMLEVFIRRGV